MIISIDTRGGELEWSASDIEDLARFALEYMKAPDACELSISLVDIDEIHRLNREYRGVDRPTDVLSFECDDPWDEYPEGEPIEIGDVVICLEVVNSQRVQFGTSFEQEASLMLVHSILHLLGYDHMEDEEAEQMEALEKEILEAYGLCGIR